MRRGTFIVRGLLALFAGAFLLPSKAPAWTPQSQVWIGERAARLGPHDLYRQLKRHSNEYRRGLLAPFRDGQASFHEANPNGSGRLDEVIALETQRVISSIRQHKPFAEVAYQAGVLAHYIADANNPLNSSDADDSEPRYYEDYLRYLESVEDRVDIAFYGLDAGLEEAARRSSVQEDDGAIGRFVAETLARSRELYPAIGAEYRRIEFGSGRRLFDDRSTAFGVAGIAHSRAATDIALVLRYVWLRSGGVDPRDVPLEGEGRVFVVPKADGSGR